MTPDTLVEEQRDMRVRSRGFDPEFVPAKPFSDPVKLTRTLEYIHGITVTAYREMYDKQGGCCAICKAHQSTLSRRLFVDHDHATDKIRGLLCNFCNHLLGNAKDRVETLHAAADYLLEPPADEFDYYSTSRK